MRLIKNTLLPCALLLAGATQAAGADFVLDLSTGFMPEDVTFKNLNGVVPNKNVYRRAWTKNGWAVDSYGTKGWVLLSPTYTYANEAPGEEAEACENMLSLPELEINAGDVLSWEAVSTNPDFLESYRVEAVESESGEKITLAEVADEATFWNSRAVDLSDYAGKKLTISFVCVSKGGFMMGLTGVKCQQPAAPAFFTREHAGHYADGAAAEAGYAEITLTAVNMGAQQIGGEFIVDIDGEEYDKASYTGIWNTGAEMKVTLKVPARLNRTTEYKVLHKAAGESGQVDESWLYCSTFKRRLMVDKATGFWCTNCPRGIINIETLQREFGEDIVIVDTHIDDYIENVGYYNHLGFSAVPFMKLNRISSSAATNAALFPNFYKEPVKFEISVSGAKVKGNDSAEIEVTVKAGEDITNSNNRYRVGYVVTTDFHEPGNKAYYQTNGGSNASWERFYLMPNSVVSYLQFSRHASVTSDHAFDGFVNSLPATLSPESDNTFSWSFERPYMLDHMKDGRVVVYVLDSNNGQIMNCAEYELENAEESGVKEIMNAGEGNCRLIAGAGEVTIFTDTPTDYTLQLYSMSGAVVMETTGRCEGIEKITLNLEPGIYAARLTTANGTTINNKIRL